MCESLFACFCSFFSPLFSFFFFRKTLIFFLPCTFFSPCSTVVWMLAVWPCAVPVLSQESRVSWWSVDLHWAVAAGQCSVLVTPFHTHKSSSMGWWFWSGSWFLLCVYLHDLGRKLRSLLQRVVVVVVVVVGGGVRWWWWWCGCWGRWWWWWWW